MDTGLTESAIRVDALRVVRGGNVVLPELSCDVARGSVTGLLGPSGSGKTTLIRAIVGVQRVAAGTVTVLGEPAGSPDLRARVGYMTQAPSANAAVPRSSLCASWKFIACWSSRTSPSPRNCRLLRSAGFRSFHLPWSRPAFWA